ncbi:CaiB/BaiF CoA transferase family protein [Falsiroseomonas stagni]|uniref:Crotonobetainyl-CoA:carnitine CoA-transferase CaiB n=1 Tax=Falsiroseomonas stagni DSM 19981 TaxID=1123062 RepID=A0A1I3YGW1_9PROT|nr:CoA transferase [Falsiroseomonas stagni]SFK31197.1 Crotonobetainyl-CoA:carnitine CoA-transferase CaiB [Falsiroseomonas stagni DSM 19981]
MLPLKGLRIISFEQFGAGPFATMNLADLGAEVIKVEPPPGEGGDPPGDIARHTGGFPLGENDSQYFQSFNRNKRSLTLDVRKPGARDALHRLVRDADAVLNNLRGDLPARLGLDYAALSAVKPSIVCVHLSGYGRDGERASWPAYDYLAQAEAGFCALTGEPDTNPARAGLSVVDFMSGLTAAMGLLAGVTGARATGRGCDLDVSLYDVAMQTLTYVATWYLNDGFEVPRRPRGGHPFIVPCEMFPTADGHVFAMCIKPGFWKKFCTIAGVPDLPADPRFKGFDERLANRDALMALLDPVMRSKTSADWVTALAGQVPIAPVLGLGQALTNPYFRERGGILDLPHPARPDLKVVASAIRLDGKRLPGRAGPGYGADSEAVLVEAGYTREEVAQLRALGAV